MQKWSWMSCTTGISLWSRAGYLEWGELPSLMAALHSGDSMCGSHATHRNGRVLYSSALVFVLVLCHPQNTVQNPARRTGSP